MKPVKLRKLFLRWVEEQMKERKMRKGAFAQWAGIAASDFGEALKDDGDREVRDEWVDKIIQKAGEPLSEVLNAMVAVAMRMEREQVVALTPNVGAAGAARPGFATKAAKAASASNEEKADEEKKPGAP